MADRESGDIGLSDAREQVAQACRVLARRGLAEGVLGHVSLRWGEHMLLRCRGPRERGLRFTTADDIRPIGLDGEPREPRDDGYAPPNEWPIHAELLHARPDVAAVVHAHPPDALIAGLAGLPLRPVFGAYNIPALQIARAGVPVYPRSVLITRRELAAELDAAMGERSLVIMRGHGVTTVGPSLASAVVTAVNLDALCRVSRELALLRAAPPDVPAEDLAELPDLGVGFQDEMVYRALVAESSGAVP